jgi:hypothetical protein
MLLVACREGFAQCFASAAADSLHEYRPIFSPRAFSPQLVLPQRVAHNFTRRRLCKLFTLCIKTSSPQPRASAARTHSTIRCATEQVYSI